MRLFHWLRELDRWTNVACGGTYPETLSARWAKADKCKVCRWLCRLLHFLDPGHCDRSRAYYDSLQQGVDKSEN